MPKCVDCKLHEAAFYQNIECNKLSGTGPKVANIVIIGQSPGVEEVLQQEPFVGPSGRLLNKVLSNLGLSRDDIYITNAIKCYPNNQKIRVDYINACRKYLVDEIETIKPGVIITLGAEALKSILDLDKITERRGRVYFSPEFNCNVVPTFHPSAVLRGKIEYESLIEKDIMLAKKLVETTISPVSKQYFVVFKDKTLEQLEEQLDKCIIENPLGEIFYGSCDLGQLPCHVAALDIETTGLDLYKDRVICIGLSFCPNESWIIPIYHSDYTLHDSLKNKVKTLLSHRGFICHNGYFDITMLRQFGITSFCWFDTMVAHQCIDENMPHGLKYIAPLYSNILNEYDSLDKNNLFKEPLDKVIHYNGTDTDITFQLYLEFKDKLPNFRFFYRHLMRTNEVLIQMKLLGVTVSAGRLKEIAQELESYNHNLIKILNAKFGSVNWNSPEQVSKLLFDRLKFHKPYHAEVGKKGFISVDKEVLEELARQDNNWNFIPTVILNLRKSVKKLTTFIGNGKDTGMIKYIQEDGKIHTNFNLTGSVTGRLSSSAPNLQNVSRENSIRSIFCSDSDDYKLVYIDYKQAELRVMAYLSGDQALINYCNSKDILVEIGYKLGRDGTDKDERALIKEVLYGLSYGSTAESIAFRLKKPLDEVHNFIRNLFEEFTGLYNWITKTKELGSNGSVITNCFGRTRRFPKTDDYYIASQFERQAVNFLPQSMVSSHAFEAMVACANFFHKGGYKSRLLLNEHDGLIFHIPLCETGIINSIKGIMERPMYGTTLTIPVDIKIGDNWGEMTNYDEFISNKI